jgi:hypothetical protein
MHSLQRSLRPRGASSDVNVGPLIPAAFWIRMQVVREQELSLRRVVVQAEVVAKDLGVPQAGF